MQTMRCAAIVTDIEGTTGSIAFVRTVLFPYATQHLAAYVTEHGSEPAVRTLLHDAAVLAAEPSASDERLIAILISWIAEDRKAPPLKTLQGLLWREGYERGAFAGHVYADAVAALRDWHAAGIPLYVYSSGSVAAQRLLFGYSTAGDLTSLFRGYFDTTIGPKTEIDSYRTIARDLAVPPAAIVFLSDSEGELDAARFAGFQTVRLLRPEDTPPDTITEHRRASSFAEIGVVLEQPASMVIQT